MSKSDFENVKKRINQLSSFAEYFYALQNMFDDAKINDYYNRLVENGKDDAKKYLNSDDTQKNNQLNSYLANLWNQSLDGLISTYHSNLSDNALLKNFSYGLACVKKNIPNMLFNPEKSQTTKEIVGKLEQKINAPENINAKKSDEENRKLIKDSYEKIVEDVFNKDYKNYGYDHNNDDFIRQGRKEAKSLINSETKMIAGEYIEAETKRIETNMKQYESDTETLQKLKTKLERIKKFNESKDEDSKGHVPTIIVEDKYFDNGSYSKSTDTNLYKVGPMSNFSGTTLSTKQHKNTCYFMSILIGLIDCGMGSYIQKHIIRDYDPEKKEKTDKADKAVVRLFDENGCPVDFVVDKSKPSDDKRPLWICVLEKAVSVMMNNTDFKSQDTFKTQVNRHGNGASITKDVDWNELEKKQRSNESIFEEKAFSTTDISDAGEEIGIQMILGKTCLKKCTGKPGRKIQYAKEGDETLGFIAEALQNNKLVLASTYHACNDECTECAKGIPHGDSIQFDSGFNIPSHHIVYIKSIDCDKQQIELIESMKGKHKITFSKFKKYFSDIHVTDFPKEAERLKEKEQQEQLQNEVTRNIEQLNSSKNNIQKLIEEQGEIENKINTGFEELGLKIKENDQSLQKLKANLNECIEKFDSKTVKKICNSIDHYSDALYDGFTGNGYALAQGANKLLDDIDNQIKYIATLQEQIQNSYKNDVVDVQGEIDTISIKLGNMANNIEQNDDTQLRNDKTELGKIETQIERLKNSQTTLVDKINNTSKYLDDSEQTLSENCNKISQESHRLDNDIKSQCKILKNIASTPKDIDNFINEKLEFINDFNNSVGISDQLKNKINNDFGVMCGKKQQVHELFESYAKNIQQLDTEQLNLKSAKANLEKLKNQQGVAVELKTKIADNLKGLQDIQEKKFNNLQSKETNFNEIDQKITALNKDRTQFQDQIKGLEELKLDAVTSQLESLGKQKNEVEAQIEVENIALGNAKKLSDDKIKFKITTLNDNKTNCEKKINENIITLLKLEKNKLSEIDRKISQLTNRCKKIREDICEKIHNIEEKKYQKIVEQYDFTSNKIKKWGIGVSVVGGVGTISVGLIPGVNIVFIAVPSPFALLGIILVGIYFYRNNKKPPRETIIITERGDDNGKKSINKTMKKVVEQQNELDDQTKGISGNENIIETKLVIDRKN